MSPGALATATTVAASALAAAILLWYLVKHPPFTRATIVTLVFGFGVLPITAAMVGNVRGFEATKQVDFCGGCHVMQPWLDDVRSEGFDSLASLHGKNAHIKDTACYTCHANYEMYGAVLTKLHGMKHVRAYYLEGYRGMELEDAAAKIEMYAPFANSNCTQCHSTLLPGWNDEPEHQAVVDDVRSGATSCASDGCHGPAHGVKKE